MRREACYRVDKFNGTFGSTVSSQLLQFYPSSQFLSNQQSYGQIAADSQCVCGVTDVAVAAALRFRSPVYRYVGTRIATNKPCILNSDPICPQFGFHIEDLAMMNNELAPLWSLSKQDIQFGWNLRDAFVALATHGKVASNSWATINSVAGFPAHYAVVLVNETESLVSDWKQDACNFWLSNGFKQFWWQN